MLQRYSVRSRIYSWFMKYCHPKLASAGIIAAFPVVTLVGVNTRQTTTISPLRARLMPLLPFALDGHPSTLLLPSRQPLQAVRAPPLHTGHHNSSPLS